MECIFGIIFIFISKSINNDNWIYWKLLYGTIRYAKCFIYIENTIWYFCGISCINETCMKVLLGVPRGTQPKFDEAIKVKLKFYLAHGIT